MLNLISFLKKQISKYPKILNSAIFVAIIVCFAVPFSGCSEAEQNTETQKSAINFIDDDGNEINLDKPAEKIISLYSAHTENLFYLGAGDKVVGGHKTCTYPPEAAFLEKYDYNGDPEKVIAANPDLVLIRPFIRRKSPDFISTIENAGIKVVSLYPDKFDKFDDYINKLALLTGTEQNATTLLSDFHNQLDEISKKTADISPKQKIFFESTETNIRTVTDDSMAGIAITLAGGENIAKGATPTEDGSSIAEFGEEKVLMNADNIDVYVSQRGSMNSGASKQGISERAGFDIIKALKNDRFYTINEKLISSPTFRYVKGVREIARYLYPDVMNDISQYTNDNLATKRDFANIVFKMKNLPVFVPSSSSYYQSEQKGHTFGLFQDVNWKDDDFDAIETSVEFGYIEWNKDKDDKEYFYPDNNITRDELAQAIFIMGDFTSNDKNTQISDISESKHQRIIQILVDNGVFSLNGGKFEPNRNVTNNEIINAIKVITG